MFTASGKKRIPDRILRYSRGGPRSLRFLSRRDRDSQARSNRLHDPKVIIRECILPRAIQSQYGGHPTRPFQRHGQRRSQGAVLRGIVQISRLDRWISVQDRFVILRNPSREPFALGNPQRREQAGSSSPLTNSAASAPSRETSTPPWNRAAPIASNAPPASTECLRCAGKSLTCD